MKKKLVLLSVVCIVFFSLIMQPLAVSEKKNLLSCSSSNIKKTKTALIDGWSEGTLYINDCGAPHGGFEYCGEYYANLSLQQGVGTLHFALKIGIGDYLIQHDFSVEVISYTATELQFLMDGNLVILQKIGADEIWGMWDYYYIASCGSDLPNRSGIGMINPEYFPGLNSFFYVELRFPGVSSFTITSLDVPGEQTNVSIAFDINNNGKCVGRSGEPYGLCDATVWEHEYRSYTKDGLWGVWSSCQAVNDYRSIVGSSHTLEGSVHAVLWRYDAVTIDIMSLGGSSCVSYGYDINTLGQVVGTSYREPNQWEPPHAFFFDDVDDDGVADPSEFIDLGVLPGDEASIAQAINDAGEVVGSSSVTLSDGTFAHPFYWDATSGLQPLPLRSGDVSGYANDINTNGLVVGYSTGDHDAHACLWEDQEGRILPGLGGSKGVAYAVNDMGDCVGSSTLAGDTQQHACIWKWDNVYDLNTLISSNSGWVLVEAYGINNHGQITGYGVDPSGQTRGFVLMLATGFVLEPKYTYIRSYPLGGGVFVFGLQHGSDFLGDVTLSVVAASELHADLLSETVNSSVPVAELMIHPDETVAEGEYCVEVTAEKADLECTVVVLVSVSAYETGDTSYALLKLSEYFTYLEAYYPELGDFSLEDWEIYRTYTHIWIVEHWTFINENWEIRLKIHATIPPNNWTELCLRPRGVLMPILALHHEYDGTIFEIPVEEFGTKFGY